MPKLKEEQEETEEGSEEIKEGEMPKAALDALKKHKEKSEEKKTNPKKMLKKSLTRQRQKRKMGYGNKRLHEIILQDEKRRS